MTKSLTYQPELLAVTSGEAPQHARYNARSGAFVDNMSLPVHRWYRYSAGFSADWVQWLLRDRQLTEGMTVLDPFAGVGTTLLACEAEGIESFGFEPHPFVHRVATAKLQSTHIDIEVLRRTFADFLSRVASAEPGEPEENVPKLLAKCYSSESLGILSIMRDLFLREFNDGAPQHELLWLAITAILRSCSGAGTAQWQYVLPKKTKLAVLSPVSALEAKAREMLEDVDHVQRRNWRPTASLLRTDAREPAIKIRDLVNAVVTSPPYPNNYDYADATRLEMTFWGEITGWGDLQYHVRRHLIRSCSQHAAAERLLLDELLCETILDPIRDELSFACEELSLVRETKGGRKSYHTMAAAYFRDLGLVFRQLRQLCSPGAWMCFVIGDSAPYGVYLKVDEWLGRLAVAQGFKSFKFEKIRDRNIKWKNRKHRVPLKEGRLWIEG